jgi:hypothetical protein
MAYLIEFRSALFDVSSEPENPVNPIFGHSVLKWLGTRLAAEGIDAPEPDYEDWGWYVDLPAFGSTYLVGASSEEESEGAGGSALDWIVQVEKHRTFLDKLRGKNRMEADDPLCRRIEAIIRSEPSAQGVSTSFSP